MKLDLIVQDPDRVAVSNAPLSDGRTAIVFSGGPVDAFGLQPIHVSIAAHPTLISKLRDDLIKFFTPKGN